MRAPEPSTRCSATDSRVPTIDGFSCASSPNSAGSNRIFSPQHVYPGHGIDDRNMSVAWKAFRFGLESDMRQTHRWHPDIPQVLQWLKPGRRVLTTPSQMRPSEALFGVCPDTRVTQTHRNPLEVLASLRCLVHAQSWTTRSDLLDFDRIYETCSGIEMVRVLNAAIAFWR